MKSNTEPPTFSKSVIVVIWIVLLSLATFTFNKVLDDIDNPNQQLLVSVDNYGNKAITLKRNRYGHYMATGKINGYSVDFLVDTGATLVAVPKHIAAKLNLKRGQVFHSQTANGTTRSYNTTIDRLALGDIIMTNVPAAIVVGMEFDEILLGMSFLKHLHLTQQNNTLTISVPNNMES